MKKLASLLTVLLFVLFPLVLVDGCRPSGSTPDIASPAAPTGAPATVPTPTPSPAAVPSPSLTPTPTTIAPSPSPDPTPTPGAAEVLRKLSFDIPPVHNQMLNLTAKHPLTSANATSPANLHYYVIPIGSKLWQLTWRAERFIKVGEYLGAANSLTKTGKLETEVRPRNISQAELLQQILLACQQASDALEGQIKQSYASQDYFYKWIKEDKLEGAHYNVPPTAGERGRAIVEMNKYYDRYRDDLSDVKEKLDSILRADIDYTRKKAA